MNTTADSGQSKLSLRYAFAHWYMRDSLFKAGVWEALLWPEGAEYLQGMWDRCAQHFSKADFVSPDGLDLRPPVRRSDWIILPIVFPAPYEGTEAYFGAVAVRPGRRKWLFIKGKPLVRYLLLELGMKEQGGGTVLGEWTPAAHLNYGRGPNPALDDFLEDVLSVLLEKRTPELMYIRPASADRKH